MLNNTTDEAAIVGLKETTFLVVFNSLQIIFGSAANVFEIIFLLRKRHKHNSVSDKLTLNLAIADFLALTTYVPWRTYLLHIRRTTEDYKYYTSLFVFCIFNTGNAVLLVGIDRFVAITRPLKYNMLFTGKVVWFGVAVAWGTAALLSVGHFLSFKEVLDIHKEYEFSLSCLSIAHMVAMSIIYAIIFNISRTQVKNVLRQSLHCNRSSTSPRSSKSLHTWKTVYTTFCIVCLFLATFLPYSVYRIISTFDHTITKTSKRVTWRWLMSFTFLNSCLNPFVYFIGMKKFRSEFSRSFNIVRNISTTSV